MTFQARVSDFIARATYLAMAIGLVLGSGCMVDSEEPADIASVTLRFQGDSAVRGAGAETFAERIRVDVIHERSRQPIISDFELAALSEREWEGTLYVPRQEEIRFQVGVYDANDTLIFTGESLATLMSDEQGVHIPLVAVHGNQDMDTWRVRSAVYLGELVVGRDA